MCRMDAFTRNLLCLYVCICCSVIALAIAQSVSDKKNALLFMALVTMSVVCGCMTICSGLIVILTLRVHVTQTSTIAPISRPVEIEIVSVKPSHTKPLEHTECVWLVDMAALTPTSKIYITEDHTKVVVLDNP